MCDFLAANGKNSFTGNQKLQQAIKNFFENKGRINKSGLGTGWGYTNGGIEFYNCHKDSTPADKSSLAKAIIESRHYPFNNFFLHTREASQGGICIENTQPFATKKTFFMHNGDVGEGIFSYEVLGEVNQNSSDSAWLHAALQHFIIKLPQVAFPLNELGLPIRYFEAIHGFFLNANRIGLKDGSPSRINAAYYDGKYLLVYQNENPWKELRVQNISTLETIPMDGGWCTIQVPSVIIYTSHNDESLKAMSESGDAKRIGYANIIKTTDWNAPLVDGPYSVVGNGNMQVYLDGKLVHTAYPKLSHAA